MTTVAQPHETKAQAGKYLTFVLDKECYGLEILKVREILGIMPITAIPRTPDYIEGVVNLRGKVIPVVDLRLKFSLPKAETTAQTCIIVVTVAGAQMGIIVDHVSEVLNVADQDIEATPQFGTNVQTDFIRGLGKTGGAVTILLDIDRVLCGIDAAALAEAA